MNMLAFWLILGIIIGQVLIWVHERTDTDG